MFDWGTHWFDMMFFYNDQNPVNWVLGQVEPTGGDVVFGVKLEGQGVASMRFENDVRAVVMTGFESGWGAMNRIWGTEGVIEISATGWDSLRVWSKGQTFFEEIEPKSDGPTGTVAAVRDVVESLQAGREPELSARKALMATELIFATYESARRGGRVPLPLEAEDVPIIAN